MTLLRNTSFTADIEMILSKYMTGKITKEHGTETKSKASFPAALLPEYVYRCSTNADLPWRFGIYSSLDRIFDT